MYNKIVKILFFVLLLLGLVGAYFNFKNKDNPNNPLKKVTPKLILMGNFENFSVLENYNDEVLVLSNNKESVVVNNNYEILDDFDSNEKHLLKKADGVYTEYYYVIKDNTYYVKNKDKDLFKFNINTFKPLNDFDDKSAKTKIFDVFELVSDKIIVEVQITSGEKEYYKIYLYNYNTGEIENEHISYNKKFNQLIMRDNYYLRYYIGYNEDGTSYLFSSRTFRKLNKINYNNIVGDFKDLGTKGVIYSDSYDYYIGCTLECKIYDTDGYQVGENNYKYITSIGESNKYFTVLNNDKYGLFDFKGNSKMGYDFRQIKSTLNYIVSVSNESYTIYDIEGKELKTTKTFYKYGNVCDIDLKEINGVLIMTISNDKNGEYHLYHKGSEYNLELKDYIVASDTAKDYLFVFKSLKDYQLFNTESKIKSIITKKSLKALSYSSKDNLACIMAYEGDNVSYILYDLNNSKETEVSAYNCISLKTMDDRVINKDTIILEDKNGNKIEDKITSLEQISEYAYKVKFNNTERIYKYIEVED